MMAIGRVTLHVRHLHLLLLVHIIDIMIHHMVEIIIINTITPRTSMVIEDRQGIIILHIVVEGTAPQVEDSIKEDLRLVLDFITVLEVEGSVGGRDLIMDRTEEGII